MTSYIETVLLPDNLSEALFLDAVQEEGRRGRRLGFGFISTTDERRSGG